MSVPGTGNDIVGAWKTVIHEPLGDVLGLDARFLFERPQVDDELVRHAPALAAIEHR